ncbi:lactonase family protein [Streptomyces sp. NBRC 109706]|uniref:lactonase family protein n=1 Tax=Streptomyces sp. NBRC 109706 TaxID=1550035 RepID=UPI000784687A|nr:lactonase family protein [Streptomyces sp. NBRC 109706]
MADRLICVGSYTPDSGGSGAGLTVFREDADSGALTLLAELDLPGASWLAWHPRLPVGYAVNELEKGGVTAFSLAQDGTPRVLGRVDSGGSAPCHLVVTPDGRHVVVAHYGSGSAAVFAVDEEGRLQERTDLAVLSGSGPHRERQEAPHAHMVVLDASGSLVTVVDLGTDTLWSFSLTPDGRLVDRTAAMLPAGCGPRQLVRDGAGRAYLVAELTGELIALREPAPGAFEVVASVPASGRPEENAGAQLTLGADGRFGYVSNRGPDTVTVFALPPEAAGRDAAPEVAGEYVLDAAWPRHFALDGGRLYAAGQFDDVLVTLDLDPATGLPTERARQSVASPAFVTVVPER